MTLIAQTQIAQQANPINTLQLGQVVFAKVLRVYQNNSYSVDIHGREHIVDSAIPLSQGEVLRGRIVGVGEKIVLEKIVHDAHVVQTEPAPADSTLQNAQIDQIFRDLSHTHFEVQAFIRQHQSIFSQFSPPAWKNILQMIERSSLPQSVLLAAVYFQKMGITVAKNTEHHNLLRDFAQYLAQNTQDRASQFALHKTMPAIQLNTQNDASQINFTAAEQAQQFVEQLQQNSNKQMDYLRQSLRKALLKNSENTPREPTDSLSTDELFAESEEGSQLFNSVLWQWLLNVQTEGAMSHQSIILPLVLNGELVELEMALFQQQPNAVSELRSKMICISLQLAELGDIKIQIHDLNQHLKILFIANSENTLNALAKFQSGLRNGLTASNYQLDQITYMLQSDTSDTLNPVMQTVLELRVNADSLSLLG